MAFVKIRVIALLNCLDGVKALALVMKDLAHISFNGTYSDAFMRIQRNATWPIEMRSLSTRI